jgi:AcrR family transcriptional regulator
MFTEQQIKWLKRTEELFMRYGIKSLTMDDVARELGISKKTLYQFVENKNDLVLKVIEQHIDEDVVRGECWHREAKNAVEEILLVIQHAHSDFARIKSNVIYDLQRYHRDAWERMQEYQRGFMHRMVRENIERGRVEGLYRSDFDVDVIARLHVAESFILFDEAWFPRPPYSLEVLFREYMWYYLHGILSEKGRQFLKEKQS